MESLTMESLLSPPPPLLDHYSSVHGLDNDEDKLFTNQILDILFESRPNEKLGFGVRIDDNKKILQINNIDNDSEAQRVGLKHGDILIAVNDTDIGSKPQIGLEELKKCKAVTETVSIRITIVRRIFDHIMIKVQRAGIDKCNGKYYFRELDDEYDSPIFEHQDNNLILCKANYDIHTAESLWTISDEINNYYIGVSVDLMPPNDSWNPIKNVGKYPCPGLVFYNTQQRLIEVEDDNDQQNDEQKQDNIEILEEDEDEYIDVNYEMYTQRNGNKKRMSKLEFEALNDPSLLSHSAVVYEHMHQLDEVDNESDSESFDINNNEWKIKYNELLEKFNESEENVRILRENVRDLNTSFYEYWLKDKNSSKQQQRLADKIEAQNHELFEQNRAEVTLINQIKEKRKETKINSLYDINLDELFANDNKYNLEIEENEIDINVESENVIDAIEQLNDEMESLRHENMRVDGLKQKIYMLEQENNKITVLYDQINHLKQENNNINQLNHEIKQQNMKINELNNENKTLEIENKCLKTENKSLNDIYIHKESELNEEINYLKQMNINIEKTVLEKDIKNNKLEKENEIIIQSKMTLIERTAKEIVKLKNIINVMLNVSEINDTVITEMLLCK